MYVTFIILIALGIMGISDKLWGNPMAYIGVGYLAFCVALIGGVVLKAIGLSL